MQAWHDVVFRPRSVSAVVALPAGGIGVVETTPARFVAVAAASARGHVAGAHVRVLRLQPGRRRRVAAARLDHHAAFLTTVVGGRVDVYALGEPVRHVFAKEVGAGVAAAVANGFVVLVVADNGEVFVYALDGAAAGAVVAHRPAPLLGHLGIFEDTPTCIARGDAALCCSRHATVVVEATPLERAPVRVVDVAAADVVQPAVAWAPDGWVVATATEVARYPLHAVEPRPKVYALPAGAARPKAIVGQQMLSALGYVGGGDAPAEWQELAVTATPNQLNVGRVADQLVVHDRKARTLRLVDAGRAASCL